MFKHSVYTSFPSTFKFPQRDRWTGKDYNFPIKPVDCY